MAAKASAPARSHWSPVLLSIITISTITTIATVHTSLRCARGAPTQGGKAAEALLDGEESVPMLACHSAKGAGQPAGTARGTQPGARSTREVVLAWREAEAEAASAPHNAVVGKLMRDRLRQRMSSGPSDPAAKLVEEEGEQGGGLVLQGTSMFCLGPTNRFRVVAAKVSAGGASDYFRVVAAQLGAETAWRCGSKDQPHRCALALCAGSWMLGGA